MENAINGKSKKIIITIGIMLVMFLASLDMLIVANALPKIAKLINGGQYQTWVITIYTLVMTIVVPIAGKLTDMYGRKYIYVFGIVWFVLGSALCGLSQNMIMLIVFRGIQGIGGGIVMGVSMAVISDVFPPAEVGKYMGVIMSMSAVASLVGPSLGGFLTDHLSWRWVFYVNVPVGIAAAIVLLVALPAAKNRDRSQKIDFIGAGLTAVFAAPLLLALTWGGKAGNGGYAWNSAVIITLLAVAVVAFAALIIVELNVKHPIIPLIFFKRPVFAVVNAANFCFTIAMMGAMVFMPQFCQYLMGYSATKSGGLQTPMMVCLTIGSIAGGQIVARIGKYKAINLIGAAISVVACALLCTLGVGTADWMIILILALFGFGAGVFFPCLTIALRNVFNKSELGSAMASFQFYKNLATSLGVAILGSVVSSSLISYMGAAAGGPVSQTIQDNLANSYRAVFIICVCLSVAVLLISFFLKELPLRKDDEDEIPELTKAGEEQ